MKNKGKIILKTIIFKLSNCPYLNNKDSVFINNKKFMKYNSRNQFCNKSEMSRIIIWMNRNDYQFKLFLRFIYRG
jgi:hypothetical protein